ncbi:hypothetical protein P153DRAFT_386282 [Dothidotthia symphoricarpi CBS 119687]|uniref:Cytochrome P450 n=1 Tax=Dothidotthia symphoricarpi CBS 119687 TaxID=1392245 RepID=A0A6A6ADR1_9PLEO|nr:uncharacterized protein P153DRAFT_386282 [Dothidotthia symphoricarpi CBS 119687]KAF2129094.1 hypothetical protein P153DRAFT_386282 [Dothidotthia symphoricarpi CBS 119687]
MSVVSKYDSISDTTFNTNDKLAFFNERRTSFSPMAYTSLYGDNAREFYPERWEGTDLEKTIGWGFMPFHGGPRTCLSKDFAMTEASYGITKVIQTFPQLRLPPDVEKEATG